LEKDASRTNLPEPVWAMIERFIEVDVMHRPMPKPEGFG
jgi:hypothetical protein